MPLAWTFPLNSSCILVILLGYLICILDLIQLKRKFLISLLPSHWMPTPPFIFLGFELWSYYWFLFYLHPTFTRSENGLALPGDALVWVAFIRSYSYLRLLPGLPVSVSAHSRWFSYEQPEPSFQYLSQVKPSFQLEPSSGFPVHSGWKPTSVCWSSSLHLIQLLFFPLSFHASHAGLLAAPQTRQACPWPKCLPSAMLFLIFAYNLLPHLLRSWLKYHFSVNPSLITLFKIAFFYPNSWYLLLFFPDFFPYAYHHLMHHDITYLFIHSLSSNTLE